MEEKITKLPEDAIYYRGKLYQIGDCIGVRMQSKALLNYKAKRSIKKIYSYVSMSAYAERTNRTIYTPEEMEMHGELKVKIIDSKGYSHDLKDVDLIPKTAVVLN